MSRLESVSNTEYVTSMVDANSFFFFLAKIGETQMRRPFENNAVENGRRLINLHKKLFNC